MAKKKLGIASIEVNKKFVSRDEALKYGKRLTQHIRQVCKIKANKGYQAQAMVVLSNIRGSVSYQYYESTGKVGRPKKIRKFSDFDYKWYKGNMTTEWHIHILLVSKPSYMFRELIKKYIDKNWTDIPNAYEKEPFDLSKCNQNKKVYKKNTNIGIAEYFIDQAEVILFVNANLTDELIIPNEYTLKKLYYAYMRSMTAKKRCASIGMDKVLKLETDYHKIRNYYFDITKEQDKKETDNYMKKVKMSIIKDNYNKVQNISRRVVEDKSVF